MTVLRWTITFDLHISGNERKKFFVNTYKNNFWALYSLCTSIKLLSKNMCFILTRPRFTMQTTPHWIDDFFCCQTKTAISLATKVGQGRRWCHWNRMKRHNYRNLIRPAQTPLRPVTLLWLWEHAGAAVSMAWLQSAFSDPKASPGCQPGLAFLAFSASGALGSFCFLGSRQL